MGIYKFIPVIISLLPCLALRNHRALQESTIRPQPGPKEPVFPELAGGVAN